MSQDEILGLVNVSERRFAIDEVLPHAFNRNNHLNRPRKRDYDGVPVNMDSRRYMVFKRSLSCHWCGVDGKFFLLQTFKNQPESAHFNLYSTEDDGSLVLMTKDHVIARSNGGTDQAKNLVTMCRKCNELKADRDDVLNGEDWLGREWFEQRCLVPWISVRKLLVLARKREAYARAITDFLAYYDKYDGKLKRRFRIPLRRWMYENGRMLVEMISFHKDWEKRHAEGKKTEAGQEEAGQALQGDEGCRGD